VRSGSSYISQNDLRVHFGLGSAAQIDYVEVRWPSGIVERFENVLVDGIRSLSEGSGKPSPAPTRK
jgi:enediyne biosynthesis protein E4